MGSFSCPWPAPLPVPLVPFYLPKDRASPNSFLSVFIYLFYSCAGSSLLLGLSLVVVSRGLSSLQCSGFSVWWLLLLQRTDSRHLGFSSCGVWTHSLGLPGSRAHGLSSCGVWTWSPCSMWNLPGSGIKPISPALAGGFLTTGPPGKSSSLILSLSPFLPYFLLSLQTCSSLLLKKNSPLLRK